MTLTKSSNDTSDLYINFSLKSFRNDEKIKTCDLFVKVYSGNDIKDK